MGITASVVTSSSTTSNQLEAGSIIVRHIKSISVPSLTLRAYGPIRYTHKTSQGFVTTSLAGSIPYLCLFHLLLNMHDSFWHVIGWNISYLSNYLLRVTLFKTCVSRMLQVVVVPGNCSNMKNFGNDQFAMIADDLSTLHQWDGIFVCFAFA